ncbi:MAG: IS3 family transposase [Burkholderiales bacterium]
MKRILKREYTAEFREQAVAMVNNGRSVPEVAGELGLIEQTLRNWVKAAERGRLNEKASKVTEEQMELSRLRAENARLRMENEIPKKSDGVLRQGCTVKYAWMQKHGARWPLGLMCEVLEVSVSGLRAWRTGGRRDPQRLSDTQLLVLIRAIHAQFKGAYGSPRIYEELRDRGHRVGKARVERLMRSHAIRARHKRRWKATTDSKHDLPVAANLVVRDFSPREPNQTWGADITYIATDEGWLYLAIVLDFFNREIVGWALKERLHADLATDALTMAWFRRRPGAGLIHHSDRGVQYASQAFQAKLGEYGMRCSMSRKGNCWDNAPTESFFNSLKNERVHGGRYRNRADAKADVFEYIEMFYNRVRRHSTLGQISPERYMQDWLSKQSKAA